MYTTNPVDFDGTNDYLNRGAALSGLSDSKLFTASFWHRQTAASTQRVVWGGAAQPHVLLFVGANGSAGVLLRDSAGTVICNIANDLHQDNEWHHSMVSVDLANAANRHLYYDNVSDLIVTTYTDATIGFTSPTEWLIGANNTFAQKFDGDLADLWVAPGVYIDLSVQANREKFILGYAPVDLGADGSLPTGSAPAIFLSGATSTWQTNLGTGGGFTENGALADGTVPLPTRKVILTRPA